MSKELQEEEETFDERLLGCVDTPMLLALFKERGLNVPSNIDSDVLGMLRILAAKFAPLKVDKPPKKLSEMGKALRPVLSGESFATPVFMNKWFIVPDSKVGFIRGWHYSVYAPSTARYHEDVRLGGIIESVLVDGRVMHMAAIEQRIPRTIRYRRGTYANTIFDFNKPGIVTLDSSPKPIRRSLRKISVSTEDLSAAMLLLKKTGSDTVHVAYQPWKCLILATDHAFAMFSKWTKDLGPPPSRKN